MTLLAMFQVLLHRYSGQDDIMVAAPSAGRTHKQTEPLIGFFVNMLVLRGDLSGDPTLLELLQRTRSMALEAYDHQDLPFEKLVEELHPERSLSHSPLFQVSLSLQNEDNPVLQVPGLTVEVVSIETGSAKLDLLASVRQQDGELVVKFGYQSDLFEDETMARMLRHFQVLIEELVSNPSQRVSCLPMSTKAEREQRLQAGAGILISDAERQCLHHLFELQAVRTPDAMAVRSGEQTLTFMQLNRRSNQLANYLMSAGLQPEGRVALLTDPSLETLIGLLAILKAGGAFVPLDPAFPVERLAFIIRDSQAALLVTQQQFVSDVGNALPAIPAICLDGEREMLDGLPAESAAARVLPEHLAYIVYTSGSTGPPKGVAVEHRNIVSYVLSICDRLDLGQAFHYALVSTMAADLGYTVVFPSLLTGGCLHLISREQATDGSLLGEYFDRFPIDCLKIVPSHLAALMDGPNPERLLPRRRLILGGEGSRAEWIATLLASAPECQIFNHYGPTETTVGAVSGRLTGASPYASSGSAPLGPPLGNAQVYILDGEKQPVPIGVVGELHIGGRGVARGYWNRPQLTVERFIPHPFDPTTSGARLYVTGDRGRFLSDGSIEFLGRTDQQIKLHGYRIEIGEIEAVLNRHPGISEAIVIAMEEAPGDIRLAAYVVPRMSSSTALNGLKTYQLPNNVQVAHLNRHETEYLYREIFELRAYLRHGITVGSGDCIFDVGANIGLFSLFVHQMCHNPVVYAFEPNPAVSKILNANVKVNKLNVEIFNCGLSSAETSAQLTFFEGFSLFSGLHADAEAEKRTVKTFMRNQYNQGQHDIQPLLEEADDLLEGRFTPKTFPVRLRTLSSVIADKKISRIDLLKINAEKSEWEILQGIEENDWDKIRQIVLEVDLDETLPAILQTLEQHGFETVVEQDALLAETPLRYVYAVRPSANGLNADQQAEHAWQPVLPSTNGSLTVSAIKDYMRRMLPEIMIPSAFVFLDSMPLLPNGKVDRRSLLPPMPDSLESSTPYIVPRNPVEHVVAGIWSEVLKRPRVSIGDNFFEIGGHSLSAIQVASRIRSTFRIDLPLRRIFEAPTVEGLSEVILASERTSGEVREIARMVMDIRTVAAPRTEKGNIQE
jgi:amino acid adenylation domain-containing protein/FkbM family methyltransferase